MAANGSIVSNVSMVSRQSRMQRNSRDLSKVEDLKSVMSNDSGLYSGTSMNPIDQTKTNSRLTNHPIDESFGRLA